MFLCIIILFFFVFIFLFVGVFFWLGTFLFVCLVDWFVLCLIFVGGGGLVWVFILLFSRISQEKTHPCQKITRTANNHEDPYFWIVRPDIKWSLQCKAALNLSVHDIRYQICRYSTNMCFCKQNVRKSWGKWNWVLVPFCCHTIPAFHNKLSKI